jgi:hypothetical protein
MVSFVVDDVLSRLDKFVDSAENALESGNLDEAQRRRLEFKRETIEITKRLVHSYLEDTSMINKLIQ